MTKEKFKIEIDTLKSFFETYCHDKHEDIEERTIILEYKEKVFFIDLKLCPQCFDSINYSFERLKECPHEIKPRCRKCPTPCYEKPRWKEAARVMKYSAIKLSLGKIKSRIFGSTK